MTFKEYLENISMAGAPAPTVSSKELSTGKGTAGIVTTYELEMIGNDIIGRINGQDIGKLSIQDFSTKYPDIAKEVLPILKRDGAAKYAPDMQPPMDFVKNPQTKNTMVATPDI